jgi:hypothetical protein
MSTSYKAGGNFYIRVANMKLVIIRNNVACVWDKKCTNFCNRPVFVCVCMCVRERETVCVCVYVCACVCVCRFILR